jgi:hypothetical protein
MLVAIVDAKRRIAKSSSATGRISHLPSNSVQTVVLYTTPRMGVFGGDVGKGGYEYTSLPSWRILLVTTPAKVSKAVDIDPRVAFPPPHSDESQKEEGQNRWFGVSASPEHVPVKSDVDI